MFNTLSTNHIKTAAFEKFVFKRRKELRIATVVNFAHLKISKFYRSTAISKFNVKKYPIQVEFESFHSTKKCTKCTKFAGPQCPYLFVKLFFLLILMCAWLPSCSTGFSFFHLPFFHSIRCFGLADFFYVYVFFPLTIIFRHVVWLYCIPNTLLSFFTHLKSTKLRGDDDLVSGLFPDVLKIVAVNCFLLQYRKKFHFLFPKCVSCVTCVLGYVNFVMMIIYTLTLLIQSWIRHAYTLWMLDDHWAINPISISTRVHRVSAMLLKRRHHNFFYVFRQAEVRRVKRQCGKVITVDGSKVIHFRHYSLLVYV